MNTKVIFKDLLYTVIALFFLSASIKDFLVYKKEKGRRELTSAIGAALVFIAASALVIISFFE
ncbi:hypothetical protein [Inconstantimicrobium porci]|uniref:Uncharacterized protein n=1 Tax=Inconstantimicrobium porci TaxID=2652291 RepID=A0A7X2T2S2_9CLOT|nr:hypothetical protein [Inconstantimicrobium porci]MSR92253.1 hypothetical protein [Inconstantimicrobium porci]